MKCDARMWVEDEVGFSRRIDAGSCSEDRKGLGEKVRVS